MGRLNKARIYLCGAIDRVSDGGVGWRKNITPFLKAMGCEVFDPTNKPPLLGWDEGPDWLARKAKLKQEENWAELARLMKEVRIRDLALVDNSQALIVYLDSLQHPCGTWEEIFWANRLKRPILIKFNNGPESVPDWLWGTLPEEFFFFSWTQLERYMLDVDAGSKTHKRWILFNY